MAQKKKLQVFVSSTYEDLKEERQAAVEAILTAGHIPAGMELFAAGDQSQMAVIRRWIDESDVFLLIPGGRYGSIERESGKSYIHLEYEYALEQGKPLFAVVITPEHLEVKVQRHGTGVVELKEPQKLEEFRDFVKTKLVKFWGDPRDIKVAIYETISDFLYSREMVGWVPGSEVVDTGTLAEEIARLTKENAALRSQLERATLDSETYNSLSFDELYNLLLRIELDDSITSSRNAAALFAIMRAFGDEQVALIHLFWLMHEILQFGVNYEEQNEYFKYVMKLSGFGLLTVTHATTLKDRFSLSDTGTRFLLRLRIVRDVEATDQFILGGRRSSLSRRHE